MFMMFLNTFALFLPPKKKSFPNHLNAERFRKIQNVQSSI